MPRKQSINAIFVCVSLLVLSNFNNAAYALEKFIGFGNSITAGWPYIQSDQNGSRAGGYEPPLEALLISSGYQAIVLNYGHPGETSSDGNDRIQSMLNSEKPDWVLLMDGTNDLYYVDVGTVMTNLASMVDKVIASGATPILATITPDTRGGKPIIEMNEDIREWTSENGVRLADQYAAVVDDWDNLHSGDQLHPNSQGYEVIAQTWFDAISLISIVPIIMLLLED